MNTLEIPVHYMVVRAVYAAFTLYMMLILLRWLSPWLQVDLYQRRLRWVTKLTDPLLKRVRGLLSGHVSFMPFDLSPIVALFVIWVLRGFVVGVLSSVVQ